jgi:hypothetical protein
MEIDSWFAYWLVDLVCWLGGWFFGSLARWFFDSLVQWFVGWLVGWLVD